MNVAAWHQPGISQEKSERPRKGLLPSSMATRTARHCIMSSQLVVSGTMVTMSLAPLPGVPVLGWGKNLGPNEVDVMMLQSLAGNGNGCTNIASFSHNFILTDV